jgi:hypothetical protein
MKRPLWVRFSLWGVPSRNAAWVYVGVCGLGLIGCLVAAVVRHWFFFIAALAAAWSAVMYWQAILWVDQHDSWDKTSNSPPDAPR